MPSTTQYRRRGTTGRAARAGSCDRRGASMNIRRTVITVAAALALAAGGTAAGAVAFASSGTTYQGCVVGTSRILEHVYTRSNPPACPTGTFGATWNAVGQQGPPGPQGPSGVLSMAQFNPGGTGAQTGGFNFIGSQVAESFANSNTAAEVTATIDISSNTASPATANIGICYQKVGQSFVNVASAVAAVGFSPSAQTVSGIVGNLSGNYFIGACEANASSNLVNGAGVGTVIMAETG